MGIDKLKLAGAIKLFAIFTYLIYFAINNTSLIKLYENIAYLKPETELKRELLSNKCLLLLGGSNVRMGMSAEAISIKSCEALNLGLSGEGGGFQKYLNWLNHITLADKVIYSSALIWNFSPLIEFSEEVEVKFPRDAIFTFIKIILLNIIEDPPIQFNNFGDQTKYQCHNNFLSYDIKINEFIKSNHLISKEIYKRISSLRKATNSSEVFVRVPPVYVKDKNKAELYTNLMNKRIEILKGLGVKIVGSTIVSTDASLFCDSYHPNAKGREEFTTEIVLP